MEPNWDMHKDRVRKVEAKIKERGCSITDACKELGIKAVGYHNSRTYVRRLGEAKPKKTRKVKSLLTVTDLPTVNADHGKLFMVLGPPEKLAEFARSFS